MRCSSPHHSLLSNRLPQFCQYFRRLNLHTAYLLSFVHLASFQAIESVDRPILKTLDIIECGPTTNGVRVCMWDERIWRESLQRGLLKTQHSINYVVYEERTYDSISCRTLIPSFRELREEHLGPWPPFWRSRTTCILRLGFSYGSPINKYSIVPSLGLFVSLSLLFARGSSGWTQDLDGFDLSICQL